MEKKQLLHQIILIFTNANSLLYVLLLHSRSRGFSHASRSLDKLAQRHKGRYWSNNPLNFWSGGGGVCCVTMWVSYSGKKKNNPVPRCPTFPCTDTHVSTIRHTLTTAAEVSGYATILICVTNTHMVTNTKTHSCTHAQNQVSMCRQGSRSLFAPGRGWWLCVSMCV